jgi:hypothetical protein
MERGWRGSAPASASKASKWTRREALFPLRATTTAADHSRDARAAAENRGVPYESWVDRQIREAIERGEFDNLPGQGRPIKGLNGRDDENWWVKAYLEREQLPLPLPTSLALRKEVRALPETLADITDEESVRQIVRDLNRRIAESHRIRADGPPIVIGLVSVEQAVTEWRRRRA